MNAAAAPASTTFDAAAILHLLHQGGLTVYPLAACSVFGPTPPAPRPGEPPLRAGMSVEIDVDTGHARGLPSFLPGLFHTTSKVDNGDRTHRD